RAPRVKRQPPRPRTSPCNPKLQAIRPLDPHFGPAIRQRSPARGRHPSHQQPTSQTPEVTPKRRGVPILDCRSVIAVVCRRTWAVTLLARSEGQRSAAAVVCLLISHSTASRLSDPPRLLGNSGSSGSPWCSLSQTVSALTVWVVSGTVRCLRFLPLVNR